MLLSNIFNKRITNAVIITKTIKKLAIIKKIIIKEIIKTKIIFILNLNLIKLINSINYRISSIMLI